MGMTTPWLEEPSPTPLQMVALAQATPWSCVVPATDTGLPGVPLVMGTTTPWFELPTASPTEQS